MFYELTNIDGTMIIIPMDTTIEEIEAIISNQ